MINIKVVPEPELDRLAAEAIRPGVIALPTGTTPLGMYRELRNRQIDWQKLKIFILDVNYPQDPQDPDSFNLYISKNLPGVNFNILDSQTKNPDQECRDYEAKIKAAGGLDLAILGIGANGHIAYNEPGASPEALTSLVELSPETIAVNRLSQHQGLTMGIKTIMNAKKILVLAKGPGKAAAVKAALTPPPRPDYPASWLQRHPDCNFLIDPAAAGKL